MLLDFILGICLVILLLQGMIIYLQVHEKLPTKKVKLEKPKNATVIQCQFCKKQLEWNARRTKEGYWACDHCRITKLNQLIS